MTVMRRCARCGLEKPVEEFGFKVRERGSRLSYCRPCAIDYAHAHYIKNRPVYLRRAQERNRVERNARWALLEEYLRSHPCVDCGTDDLVVLEFDHRDRADKTDAISNLIRCGRSWTTVLAEIAKCDVRCVNCHRRRTSQQCGWRGPKVDGVRLGAF